MALWELDAFQGPAFLGFVRNVPTPFPFISNRWLPDRRVPDIDVSYIKGSMQRPVMAHLVGFDSEAPIGGRQPLGTRVQLDLTPIKRKYRIGEKELIRFYQPRANSADVQVAIDEVFNLTRQGLDSIQARAEWLKMQALSQDTVVYDEAGVVMSFDYGITNAYQIDLPNQTDGARRRSGWEGRSGRRW